MEGNRMIKERLKPKEGQTDRRKEGKLLIQKHGKIKAEGRKKTERLKPKKEMKDGNVELKPKEGQTEGRQEGRKPRRLNPKNEKAIFRTDLSFSMYDVSGQIQLQIK